QGATAGAPSERRSASAMAVGTVLSRLTGFARQVVLLSVLGVTQLGDAFNTANTVPNMLLFLVTGGTVSAVLIPMLARQDDVAKRRHDAETIGGLIVLLTATASILMLVTAPLVARLFALEVSQDHDAFVRVTTQWLALFSPQILFYGLSVYAVAVLNAHGRLALAGFAPIATNAVAIAAALAYVRVGAPNPPQLTALGLTPLVVLGVGTTLSVAAMAIPQMLGARRVLPGLRLRPRVRLRDPATLKLWHLGRWTLVYVAVNQVGLTVVVTLANGISQGATIAYQTAFAIMQLPFAIVAVSLFSAIYPRLSRAASQSGGLFGATVSGGLRLANALLIPAAVGLVVLAQPVGELLVSGGPGQGTGTRLLTVAIAWFGVALIPFTVFQLLTRSYYAFPDTRTPALVNIAVNVVNVGAALLAFAVFADPATRLAGLVVAYGMSYVTGCACLGVGLLRRRPGSFAGALRGTATALLASGVMAAVLLAGARAWSGAAGPLPQLLRTGALVAAGGGVYLAVAWLLRSPELAELAKVRRR
ncbi:MAG: murein biosynthesis integral membrane protein MurJ, partial [Egibacteraceae bacterium]